MNLFTSFLNFFFMLKLGNYLSDFIYTSTATITLDAKVIYSDSSLEKCSKSCVTSDGFLCKSFHYCEETKKCLLNSGMKTISNKNSTSKDSCANYKSKNLCFLLNILQFSF